MRLLGCTVVLFAGLAGQLFAQTGAVAGIHPEYRDSGKTMGGNSSWSDTSISSQNVSNAGTFVLGVTMGAPSGLSVLGGCSFADFGLRVSGGSWGKNWNGVQGDLSYSFVRSSPLTLSISVIAGQFQNKTYDTQQGGQYVQQKYYGLGYDMSMAGLFLQAGLATGPGEYSNPQFTFQFGYLWEF